MTTAVGDGRSGTTSRVRRILLLCALTLSVLGMHHVAAPPQETGHAAVVMESTVAAPADDPGHGPGHDLLHLCLVVLTAVLLLAGRLRTATRSTAVGSGTRRPPSFPRPPVAAGRSLLTSVCVLRL